MPRVEEQSHSRNHVGDMSSELLSNGASADPCQVLLPKHSSSRCFVDYARVSNHKQVTKC